jgi:hypothetical protein
MHFERQAALLAQLRHEVREEQQVVNIVAVGDVDVPSFSVGFDASHFCGQIA